MTEPRIVIAGWEDHYETGETRKLVRLRWVPVPNTMGRGYAKLMARHGYRGLGVWTSILQIASRKHRDKRNGVLDYTLEDLALESRGDLLELQEILPTLTEIGWLQEVSKSAGTPGDSPDEGKGREGKEGKGTEVVRKRTPGPQDQLARDLAAALGSSLNPCRKQIKALVAHGMSLDSIRPHIGKALPGMAPWDWSKHVTGGGASTGAAPTYTDHPCPKCGTGRSASPTSLCLGCLVAEKEAV